jgi:TolB protein
MLRTAVVKLLVGFSAVAVLALGVQGVGTAAGSADPQGTNAVQITSQSGLAALPTWSKDGSQILFLAATPGGMGISKVSAGGGEVSSVTTPSSAASVDMWMDVCPKDDQIIFASTRGGDHCRLYTVAQGQASPSPVPIRTETAQFPSWSPDGSRIAFSSPDENGIWWVWVVSKDGTGPFSLAEGVHPRWSPDGKRVAYAKLSRTGSGSNWDIYASNVDGSGSIRLTWDPADEFEPDWSPDGQWICYTRTDERDTKVANIPALAGRTKLAMEPSREIWARKIGDPKAGPVRIMDSAGLNAHPRWSPDGKRIVFASDRGGSMAIWAVPASFTAAQ